MDSYGFAPLQSQAALVRKIVYVLYEGFQRPDCFPLWNVPGFFIKEFPARLGGIQGVVTDF